MFILFALLPLAVSAFCDENTPGDCPKCGVGPIGIVFDGSSSEDPYCTFPSFLYLPSRPNPSPLSLCNPMPAKLFVTVSLLFIVQATVMIFLVLFQTCVQKLGLQNCRRAATSTAKLQLCNLASVALEHAVLINCAPHLPTRVHTPSAATQMVQKLLAT